MCTAIILVMFGLWCHYAHHPKRQARIYIRKVVEDVLGGLGMSA